MSTVKKDTVLNIIKKHAHREKQKVICFVVVVFFFFYKQMIAYTEHE